jgi:cobalt-zinc-cadmium efflux system membrane fusion protein
MKMTSLHHILSGIAMVSIAACSRGTDRPSSEGAKAGSDSMETMKMPMMPASLMFSRDQIAHGKVAWAPVTMGTASGTATVPGQVATDEDHTVRLGAPARGRVLTVAVSPGDRVASGQSLVVIQSADAAAAQADVAKAIAAVTSHRAQATYAKSARDRAERLLGLKAIPRQDYERAVADDQLAQSELSQSEAELRRARSAVEQVGADTASGGTIVIRAPHDGVVLSRTAVPGTVVDAGAPLVVVTNPARLWLVVNAPEQIAGLFRTGGQLRFIVPAYPDTFSARITAVGAGLDQETRTLQVRGSLETRNERLKPGMLATVAVTGADRVTVPLVPEDAVQMLSGKPYVFVAEPAADGTVRLTRREVDLGARTSGKVAVLHGLATGDVIVTAGAFAVKAEFQKGGMPKMEM